MSDGRFFLDVRQAETGEYLAHLAMERAAERYHMWTNTAGRTFSPVGAVESSESA